MPDGRFLSKSIAHSEQLGGVSLEADYLFARCIPHLDRDGRMTGNPVLIKATVCPLRSEIQSGSIPDLLRQLAGEGLLRWYECDGKQILEFPRFSVHQRGMKYDREAVSRYVAYCSDTCTDLTLSEVRIKSGAGPDGVRPSEVKSKSSEVKKTVSTKPAPPGLKNGAALSVPAVVAPLVREHLWQQMSGDIGPPETWPKRGEKWSMGRELTIAKQFLAGGRCSLEELAGAIECARGVLGFDADIPLTLRIFNVQDRHDRLQVCVDYWRQMQAGEAAQHNPFVRMVTGDAA